MVTSPYEWVDEKPQTNKQIIISIWNPNASKYIQFISSDYRMKIDWNLELLHT